MAHPQDEAQEHSLADPESFWAKQAEHLFWHKKPSAVLKRTTKSLKDGTSHDHWAWFPDGEISTCYNCLDRHVLAGNGDVPAIFYDSPVTKTKQRITYKQLLEEVEVLAGVLRDEGVKKGDVVLVYSTSGKNSIISQGDLHASSADDPSCPRRDPSYQQTGGDSCRRLWRLRSYCLGTED